MPPPAVHPSTKSVALNVAVVPAALALALVFNSP
jgi:hypothetical protein